jgi:hypothetical protein
LGLSEQLLTISEFQRGQIIFIIFVLHLGGSTMSVCFVLIPRLEEVEIDSFGTSGSAVFLARYEYLINLLSLFSLLDHLPQDFFQHSIFGALFDDAMLRIQLARVVVQRLFTDS